MILRNAISFVAVPSLAPNPQPTVAPSLVPNPQPTVAPSLVPNPQPTPVPSLSPSPRPTVAPSLAPSPRPTGAPFEVISILYARVGSAGTRIEVSFSATPSFTLPSSGGGSCDDILSSTTLSALGVGSACSFSSDRLLIIRFGTSASLDVGDNVEFVDIRCGNLSFIMLYTHETTTLKTTEMEKTCLRECN